MKLRGAIALVLLAISTTAAAPANAASTRAEYVAQVDPICQSFVGPNDKAVGAYRKNEKSLVRVAKHGTVKQFLTQRVRVARSLKRLAATKADLTSQIATVPAPAEDSATVDAWLNYRQVEEAHVRRAVLMILALDFPKYFRQLKMADAADHAATTTVAGLGLQVCEVIV
jgi:hypothetical protein